MKNLSMKSIVKYAMFVLVGGVVLASCDRTLDSKFVNKVKNTPNLALFASTNKSVSKISDGSVYSIPINIQVAGPHMSTVSGDITVTIKSFTNKIGDGMPPGDTTKVPAVKGTNYRITDNTVTLKESNNYLGQFHFKMLTNGITAPVLPPPKVKLKVVKATGDESVIASGKPIIVTLNYACPSKMAGIYKITSNSPLIVPHKAKVFADKGLGQYHTNSIGGWYAGSPKRTGTLAPLHFGVKFSDVCGTISVKQTSLGGYYSNKVKPVTKTHVHPNPKGGALPGKFKYFILKYSIEDLGSYTVKYKRLGPLPASAGSRSNVSESNKNASVPPSRVATKLPPSVINNHK